MANLIEIRNNDDTIETSIKVESIDMISRASTGGARITIMFRGGSQYVIDTTNRPDLYDQIRAAMLAEGITVVEPEPPAE
jgi:hypothetical protein